jgi:hypothetical protein
VINCQQAGELRLLFHEHTSEYWQTHQRFGIASSTASKALGDSSIEIIIINAVVPILFSFGKYAAQPACSDRAFALLEELKPEANSIVKRFRNFGIEVKHAGDSQALIQLQREYCEKRKCLFCRFGYYVLTK